MEQIDASYAWLFDTLTRQIVGTANASLGRREVTRVLCLIRSLPCVASLNLITKVLWPDGYPERDKLDIKVQIPQVGKKLGPAESLGTAKAEYGNGHRREGSERGRVFVL